MTNGFSDFTIDFTIMQSKLTKEPYFVSYAVSGVGDNAMLIGFKNYVGGRLVTSGYRNHRLFTPIRITATLKDKTFLFFEDQKIKYEKVITFNAHVPPGGFGIIGQEQDSIGGGFDSNQRLAGKLCDLRMWKVGLDVKCSYL